MPIRLLVQKQASAVHPNVHHGKKLCSAQHCILKRNKRKPSVLSDKRVEDSAPKVQALKGQKYVKLA